MNKIQELIEKLCPEGVEYASIGSLIKRIKEKGKDYTDIDIVYSVSNKEGIVKSSEYRENEIHSEDTSNYTVIREGMFAYNPSRLNIGSIAWLKTDECGLVSPMYIVFDIDRNRIKEEFLMELIRTDKIKNKIDSLKESGARFRFDFERWNWIKIPLPPIEIQDEIIKILNKFKELTAELTAELTVRKKQYEHYRDELLTFGDEVECKALGEVCTVIAGGTPAKSNPDFWTNGTVKWLGSSVCKNQKTVDEITDYITELGLEESSAKIMKKETTLIALVGATIGKVAFLPFEASINQNIAGIYPIDTNILIPSFLYYTCGMLYEQFMNLNSGRLAMANLSFVRSLKIPVPPLEEQQRIVDILDRFDKLCNDISEGLPAEIEARQKQYEYYRDKLLTFKEKA